MRLKVVGCFCNLNFYRASGDVICQVCKLEYWKHPYCSNSRTSEDLGGNYFLHILCNGEHVKL